MRAPIEIDGDSRSINCPAKVNLLLAVHGQREDGYHELSSIMAPLDYGDRLRVTVGSEGEDQLFCDDPSIPLGPENLVLQAVDLFREAVPDLPPCRFELEKRIPVGAGLGGGSSDGSAALLILNDLSGHPLAGAELLELAARLGSDCPFFLGAEPALARGRGERLEPLPVDQTVRIRGQRLLLIAPPFGVGTSWAYARLASTGRFYTTESATNERLARFAQTGRISDLLQNSFEEAVGAKYLAIPALLLAFRKDGLNCLMSGSGSACFVLLEPDFPVGPIIERCREAWGSETFCVETSIC